jgi:hypothetical protein
LTESIVARATNPAIHYVVAVTHVFGIQVVPNLMSQKLALEIETTGIAHLVDAYVVIPRVAKDSSITAPDRSSSSEVFAVKQMNDIGIDARFSDISTKTSKQSVGFGTDSVGTSLAQERLDGVCGRIAMNLQVGDLQLLAESRHFVILAGSSDNALRERTNIVFAAIFGAERRVDDDSHLNHVKGAAVSLKGAMVVVDSEMLGRIDIDVVNDKAGDLMTTETAGLTRRHYGVHTEELELSIIQIVRGDRGIGVAQL